MERQKVLMAASVASMIDQFNLPNIRLMQELGYEVHVACNFIDGNTCDAGRIWKLQEILRDLGVRMHQWDCPRSIRPFGKCLTAWRQLRSLTRRLQFAWIHCHSPIGGALARLAVHAQGIPVIYTAHGFHFYKGAPLWNWLIYYPAEKLLANWTDILVTVNREDYQLARGSLRAKRVAYIPGVRVDTRKFAAAVPGGCSCADACAAVPKDARGYFLKRFCLPHDARVLLSVGELNPGKNHRMAIAALAALPQKDVYYLICGQGELREELQAYADRLGVGERIRLPGFCGDMPWIYQYADIFVCTSVREGMPVALMEAMAAGLPCVVSDIRGSRELIGAAGGGRFAPDQPKQLQRHLETLLEDMHKRKRCGQYNQKKIQRYRVQKVNAQMRRIYKSLQEKERER